MKYSDKKALVITALLFVCVSIFCSFVFIAGFANHDCTHGDDCEICHIIDACIGNIRETVAYTASLAAVLAAVLLAVTVPVLVGTAVNNDTLISLKVELRN